MRQAPQLPESLVFILGCQRSGSTWLANILDAGPETLVFMEPFSPPYGIFPEFPDSFYFLENSSSSLDHLLQVEMPYRLLRYKALMFRQSMVSTDWFRLERWLAKLINRVGRFKPHGVQDRIRKFELLNLNRIETSYPLYPKNGEPSVWAIKELRLAGKIPVLLSALPNAHFVVILRHPAATVHSILNWFERGHLGELSRDLETYLEKIEVQTVSRSYQHLIAQCRNGNLAHKVALYWRISYETMFTQLKQHPSVKLLIYEQLASQPKETVAELFAQLDIPWAASLDEYLSYSTNREVEMPGPITTVRKSATYYRAWLTEISEDTRQAVSDMVDDSFLMSHFGPYYAS